MFSDKTYDVDSSVFPRLATLCSLIHERHGVGNARPRGAVAVHLVGVVREAEGYAANHLAIVGQPEVAADQPGVPRQRGLWNGAETERLGGKHEVGDIGAAIDRAIDAERLVGVNDRDMRRTEEIVVLQRLLRIRRLVASDDTERVVELKTALATAVEIDAEIFARWREIMIIFRAGRGLGIDRLAKFLLGLGRSRSAPPWLAVAP
jgi:hypothetical protein